MPGIIKTQEPRYLKREEAWEIAAILNQDEEDGWEYWVAASLRPGYYHVAVYDEDHNFMGEL